MPLSDSIRADTDLIAREYDYGDVTIIAIDTAATPGDVSVDIVEDTAIIVLDTDTTTNQRELELPDGDATTLNNNGIVTIEVRE